MGTAEPARQLHGGDDDFEFDVTPMLHKSGVSESIAVRIRFAIDEIERIDVDPLDSAQAATLLADIDGLAESGSESVEGRKRELWGAVANGRAALRVAQVDARDTRTILPSTAERIRQRKATVDAAEQRASRKLASPNAYRKLIDAKKALAATLDENDFVSYEDFEAFEDTDRISELADAHVREARERLASAEAAWSQFEAHDPDALPRTPEGEALRARAYRILGSVVDDDDELRARLESLRSVGERLASALDVLDSALRDAGFEPGSDPITLGRLVLRSREAE